MNRLDLPNTQRGKGRFVPHVKVLKNKSTVKQNILDLVKQNII